MVVSCCLISPWITSPLEDVSGYPLEARMTQAAEESFHFTILAVNVPVAQAIIIWPKSLSSNGNTTCVSGSPKRALNSTTLGPWGVIIRPA